MGGINGLGVPAHVVPLESDSASSSDREDIGSGGVAVDVASNVGAVNVHDGVVVRGLADGARLVVDVLKSSMALNDGSGSCKESGNGSNGDLHRE